MAGMKGFEPLMAGPKPAALPLGYIPNTLESKIITFEMSSIFLNIAFISEQLVIDFFLYTIMKIWLSLIIRA